ncbi:TPA: hypothetical protein ACH3X1_014694 [Trebouxia sp. C0004]
MQAGKAVDVGIASALTSNVPSEEQDMEEDVDEEEVAAAVGQGDAKGDEVILDVEQEDDVPSNFQMHNSEGCQLASTQRGLYGSPTACLDLKYMPAFRPP